MVVQTWRLQGVIKDSAGVTLGHFTNGPGPLQRPWPMVKVELEQTKRHVRASSCSSSPPRRSGTSGSLPPTA